MCGGAVHGPALDTRVLLLGQAPGPHEESLGRPFAYTAGKTLFKWLNLATGADEEGLREQIYFSAVARCFPGKNLRGQGDRPPSKVELENCRPHLMAEVRALQPDLILAVGKMAIVEALGLKDFSLAEVVGKKFTRDFHGRAATVIPLPHPSGVSRWPHSAEGKVKLGEALELVREAFQQL